MFTRRVFFPLLWKLAADEILSIFDKEKISTAAYADDFVILVKGEYEVIVPGVLERLGEWC